MPRLEVLEDRVQLTTFTVPFSAPVLDPAIVANPLPVLATVGTPLSDQTLVATFSDINGMGPTGDYAASIDWGDTTPATSGVIQAGLPPISISVYAGFNDPFNESGGTPGGMPYTDLRGTLTSNDVQFADTITTLGNAPGHSFGLSSFGADIKGFISADGAGSSFAFGLNSDDGSELFIDGKSVVNTRFQLATQSIALAAGLHTFEVQYFEDLGPPGYLYLYLPEGITYAPTYAVTGSHTYTDTTLANPTVTLSSVDHFDIAGITTPGAGSPVNYTVTALDQSGQPVPDFAGTVQVSSSDTSAVLPATIGFTNGSANFDATFQTPGPQTLTLDYATRNAHGSLPVTVYPVVTMSTANLAANAASIVINGFGFDPTNSVAFNDGAVGSVTTASATSLTVTFSTKPTSAGNLTAIVTSNGQNSGAAVQVATVTPVATISTANLAADAASIVINGFGFDSTGGTNTVAFNDGAVGNVTTASATSLTVTFSTKPTSAGSLTAIVTSNGVSSAAPVQVATVVPLVTSNTAQIADSETLIIKGVGFGDSNTVTFNLGAVGVVSAASATQLTVTFSTLPAAGTLTAVVTSNDVSSGAPVQVAAVVTITLSALPDATIGQAYAARVSAGGGTGPYTFSVTDGSLPTGLTLNPDGTFTGTLSAAGAFTFTITATQSAFAKGSRAYTILVGPTISGASTVPGGQPYTLFLSPGAIPAGSITSWSISWGDQGDLSETFQGNPASVTHVYRDFPNAHLIAATVNLESAPIPAGNKVLVNVLVPAIDSANSIAMSGNDLQAVISTPDGSLTAGISRTLPGLPNTFLVVFLAHYKVDPQLGVDPAVSKVGALTLVDTNNDKRIERTAYDLRISAFLDTGKKLTPIDVKNVVLVLNFAIPQPDNEPMLTFVDPADNQSKPLHGSTNPAYPHTPLRVGNNFVFVADDTSFPTVAQLRGTVFTITDTQPFGPALLNVLTTALPSAANTDVLGNLLNDESAPEVSAGAYVGGVVPSQAQISVTSSGASSEAPALPQEIMAIIQSILRRARQIIVPQLHLELDIDVPASPAPPVQQLPEEPPPTGMDGPALGNPFAESSTTTPPVAIDDARAALEPPEVPAVAEAIGAAPVLSEKALASLALVAIPLYPLVEADGDREWDRRRRLHLAACGLALAE